MANFKIPVIGEEVVFKLKEPFYTTVKNQLGIYTSEVLYKVVSIVSMKDSIRTYLNDPFTEIYEPAELTELDYKKDLKDNISIVTLSYTNPLGQEIYVRVPVNYIEGISENSSVKYMNRTILIDLGSLPMELELTGVYRDLVDFIESRVGVANNIKDVSIGDVELVSQEDHEVREHIRTSSATINKTLSVQLEEAQVHLNAILDRLDELEISLA